MLDEEYEDKISRMIEEGGKNILDLYQEFCPTTFIYTDSWERDWAHIENGVQAEAGEIAGKLQKYYRGDYDIVELRRRLEGEIGGLMYYVAMLCNIHNLSLKSILIKNRDQLIDRQNRGAIQGDGDDR